MKEIKYDEFYDELDEAPKYHKKKGSSKSKSYNKSDHKHNYVDVLFVESGKPYKGKYCKECGKIDDIQHFEFETKEDGMKHALKPEEIFERYKHLKQIKIDSIWQKYVPVIKAGE